MDDRTVVRPGAKANATKKDKQEMNAQTHLANRLTSRYELMVMVVDQTLSFAIKFADLRQEVCFVRQELREALFAQEGS